MIDLGERVPLRNLDTGKRIEYGVVGTLEADLAAGRISAVSPPGRALLGRRRGDIVLVDAPCGAWGFKIPGIEAAHAA